MNRFSTAALTLALMTSVSGIALAAPDTSSNQGARAAAETAVPAKPAMAAPTKTMAKAAPEAAKSDAVTAPATKVIMAKPMPHKTAARRDDMDDRGTTALNLLESHGYAEVEQFREDGRNFDATVKQDGKTLQLTVNPDTGQIVHHA